MTDETISGREHPWTFRALLLTIFAMAAVLRLTHISADSIWRDEAVTWTQVNGSFLDVITRTAQDTYPPAFNILAWLSLKVFGANEFGLRFPSAVLGTLTVPVVYLLGARLGGRTVGLVAALLIALSTPAIYFSQEARPYALMCFATALHLWILVELFSRPSILRGIALALSAALLLYSHPYGFFAWLSAGVGFLATVVLSPAIPPIAWRVVLYEALGLLLFLPWAMILWRVSRHLADDGFWLDRPGLQAGLKGLIQSGGGVAASAVIFILIVCALVMVPRRAARDATGATNAVAPPVTLPILMAAALGPAILGFVISQITTPIYLGRYLICIVPPLLVLAAMGVETLMTTPRRWFTGLAALTLLGGLSLATDTRRHPEQFREVAATIRATMMDSDCLVTNRADVDMALRFYHARPKCWVNLEDGVDALKTLSSRDRLVFVLVLNRGKVGTVIESLPGEWAAKRGHYEGLKVIVLDRART